jgi:hypothetical protein
MIPKILRYTINALLMAGIVVTSFWMIGFFIPFYQTSAVMEIEAPREKALAAWNDMSRLAEWSDRFRRIIHADSVQLIAEDSVGTGERWSVARFLPPDSLVVHLERDDYDMINYFRFESSDSIRTIARRWVRIYPHGAWFDSWFFFVKSRYVDQIEHDNRRFVSALQSRRIAP